MTHQETELQLILASAAIASRRHAWREQARHIAGSIDFGALAEQLRRRRLLSTLGPNIIGMVGDAAAAGFAGEVQQATASARRHGTSLQLVGDRLLSVLTEAGIPCAALKGPQLADAVYGDVGRRLSNDVDLLVAPHCLHAAVEIVRELGYEEPHDHIESNGLPRLHLLLHHQTVALPPVELHWRIHWYEESFAHDRLLVPGRPGSGRKSPAPAAELAALLLFYARDGFVGLRLASDLSAWWDAFGTTLDRASFAELMREYPALSRVLRAATVAAHRTVGLPANQILGRPVRLGVRCRTAVRLANPNPSASVPQLYAEMGLIDGLLAPTKGLWAFVRRQLLIPREVLDQRAGRVGERATKSRAMYGVRLLIRCGVVGRYALAIARLALPRVVHA